MDVCVDTPAGVEFTNTELLVDRTILAIDNAPATIAAAQQFKRLWYFEISLFRRADDMSRRHCFSLSLGSQNEFILRY
jgi:hypothetical protein